MSQTRAVDGIKNIVLVHGGFVDGSGWKDVYRVLVREGLERPDDLPPPRHRFLATGDATAFARLGRRFLGPEIGQVSPLTRGDEEKLCS